MKISKKKCFIVVSIILIVLVIFFVTKAKTSKPEIENDISGSVSINTKKEIVFTGEENLLIFYDDDIERLQMEIKEIIEDKGIQADEVLFMEDYDQSEDGQEYVYHAEIIGDQCMMLKINCDLDAAEGTMSFRTELDTTSPEYYGGITEEERKEQKESEEKYEMIAPNDELTEEQIRQIEEMSASNEKIKVSDPNEFFESTEELGKQLEKYLESIEEDRRCLTVTDMTEEEQYITVDLEFETPRQDKKNILAVYVKESDSFDFRLR